MHSLLPHQRWRRWWPSSPFPLPAWGGPTTRCVTGHRKAQASRPLRMERRRENPASGAAAAAVVPDPYSHSSLHSTYDDVLLLPFLLPLFLDGGLTARKQYPRRSAHQRGGPSPREPTPPSFHHTRGESISAAAASSPSSWRPPQPQQRRSRRKKRKTRLAWSRKGKRKRGRTDPHTTTRTRTDESLEITWVERWRGVTWWWSHGALVADRGETPGVRSFLLHDLLLVGGGLGLYALLPPAVRCQPGRKKEEAPHRESRADTKRRRRRRRFLRFRCDHRISISNTPPVLALVACGGGHHPGCGALFFQRVHCGWWWWWPHHHQTSVRLAWEQHFHLRFLLHLLF